MKKKKEVHPIHGPSKCLVAVDFFNSTEPQSLEKCSELPPVHVCTCVSVHVDTACELVRIANSSVLCDMLQNDLKFISNKSFWLCDGFFCTLPTLPTRRFVYLYSFGRYALHVMERHVSMRFCIAQYSTSKSVCICMCICAFFHSLCSLDQ